MKNIVPRKYDDGIEVTTEFRQSSRLNLLPGYYVQDLGRASLTEWAIANNRSDLGLLYDPNNEYKKNQSQINYDNAPNSTKYLWQYKNELLTPSALAIVGEDKSGFSRLERLLRPPFLKIELHVPDNLEEEEYTRQNARLIIASLDAARFRFQRVSLYTFEGHRDEKLYVEFFKAGFTGSRNRTYFNHFEVIERRYETNVRKLREAVSPLVN